MVSKSVPWSTLTNSASQALRCFGTRSFNVLFAIFNNICLDVDGYFGNKDSSFINTILLEHKLDCFKSNANDSSISNISPSELLRVFLVCEIMMI
ncbi:SKP1 protein 1A [Trifolium repens]|nr:SKP1 protein 1A [Trifolium repens]